MIDLAGRHRSAFRISAVTVPYGLSMDNVFATLSHVIFRSSSRSSSACPSRSRGTTKQSSDASSGPAAFHLPAAGRAQDQTPQWVVADRVGSDASGVLGVLEVGVADDPRVGLRVGVDPVLTRVATGRGAVAGAENSLVQVKRPVDTRG
jgi:hypothetical protein